MLALVLALSLGQAPSLYDEGVAKGSVIRLNCVGAGINCYLDGGFATVGVAGGGGSGTVTSVSVTTANGVSGSVATATTTPAISLTLGAITPNSVAASGAVSGSNLSGTNTGDQTITLTGGVTGSGTGSFAATVVTNANLTGPVTSVGNATTIGAGQVSDGNLANNYSGVGTCTNQFARALNDNAAPTCASVAIADHSATGTPSATTFLRGDNTWAIPAGGSGGASPLIGTFMPFMLQAGDTGVRSIQSFNTGTTYTSGTMMLIAYRPIALDGVAVANMPSGSLVSRAQLNPGIRVYNDTCFAIAVMGAPAVTAPSFTAGVVELMER